MEASSNRGPLALFAAGPDGQLGRMWQPAPDVGWSRWNEVGVRVTSAPAACPNADGRVEVFAAGPSGRLGHFYQLAADDMKQWSEWADLGPVIQLEPVVFRNADGRLEVFAIGPNGLLGRTWQLEPGGESGWSPWVGLGPTLGSPPVVIQNPDGRLEVFAIGHNQRLGHIWQVAPGPTGGWSKWDSFGHSIESPPLVLQTLDGRLDVFAIGEDRCLGHVWQQHMPNGAIDWTQWGSFGHALKSPPVGYRTANGHLEVFGIGPDDCLGHLWQQPDSEGMIGWSNWGSFGQVIRSQPTLALNAHGAVEVFAIGPTGSLGHIRQWAPGGNSEWSNWEDLGVTISDGRPAVCSTRLGGGARETEPGVQSSAAPQLRSKPSTRASLKADVCVIGAGPAGITLAAGLVRAGATVALVESGNWNEEPDPQELNHGDADGPIIKSYLKYLRQGRRRQVQGSAVGWGGWCMPFRGIDFERRPWVGHSGWPVSRAELEPYERRAVEMFGFDAFHEPEPDGSLVRLSYHFPDNPLLFRAMLLELLPHSALSLELDATAIEFKKDGDRVQSVRFARSSGDDLRVSADTVVLAAGGIENPRLLLAHGQALSVEADAVGRYFMDHPHVLAGSIHIPDPTPLRTYLRGSNEPGHRTLHVLGLPEAVQRREGLLNVSVEVRMRVDAMLSDEPVEGELYLRSEQSPNPESRVSLGRRSDRFGVPQPYLSWQLLDEDWDSVVRTAELTAGALQERVGATAQLSIRSDTPWPWNPAGPNESRNGTWGFHHMGTTRMADDPSEGVVDSNCLVQGTSNLYVAGSSVFPTGGCANPTYMIVVLAHRLVDHIAAGQPSAESVASSASP
jgi:choline dehydrogenase-like flavoprotein